LSRDGIDVSVTDDQGKTAIHYATVNGKDEAVQLLEKFIARFPY
jgi:ankyrin repeat protein